MTVAIKDFMVVGNLEAQVSVNELLAKTVGKDCPVINHNNHCSPGFLLVPTNLLGN